MNLILLIFFFLFLGVQHWESMHMFFMMKRKDTASTFKHICFVILSILLFPILSVAVAWFSWPHLIGTEVSSFFFAFLYCHLLLYSGGNTKKKRHTDSKGIVFDSYFRHWTLKYKIV